MTSFSISLSLVAIALVSYCHAAEWDAHSYPNPITAYGRCGMDVSIYQGCTEWFRWEIFFAFHSVSTISECREMEKGRKREGARGAEMEKKSLIGIIPHAPGICDKLFVRIEFINKMSRGTHISLLYDRFGYQLKFVSYKELVLLFKHKFKDAIQSKLWQSMFIVVSWPSQFHSHLIIGVIILSWRQWISLHIVDFYKYVYPRVLLISAIQTVSWQERRGKMWTINWGRSKWEHVRWWI